MLKAFLKKTGIKKLLVSIHIGGETINAHLTRNRLNSKSSFNGLFRRLIKGEVPLDQAITEFGKIAETRKRQTLTTLRNIMAAVRGQARAVIASGRKGRWYNRGVLDSNTTHVCAGYMGQSWAPPYRGIPDKPPRVSVIPHPCRSFLEFVPDGQSPPDETPFMEQFNASEELRRDLLGPTRFEAMQKGELVINSFAQYEKTVLHTLEGLGL